jgi:TolB-like protein/Tfp pilus assembly protein PilF
MEDTVLEASMDPTPDLPTNIDPLTGEAILGELAKILASRAFRSAASQREFLRYTVQEAVAGRGHAIKEYMIGTEALGRDESFDPRLDPIVRTQARKLRERLAKYYASDGTEDPLIVEFPKGSYVPTFRVARSLVPVLPDAPVTEVSATLYRPRSKVAATVLAGVALVAAASLYLWQSSSPPRTALADNPSIAVMPFVNAGDSKDDEFLSDGLADELIDSLTQVPWLQVVARTSAFRFKGKATDAREIAQALKVRTMLEGRVRRSGTRLRVNVQLNNAADGAPLWSGSYDRDASDARAIQLEIAHTVTDVLAVRFSRKGEEDRPGASQPGAPPANPSAYQSYLKGRYFWNKLAAPSLKTAIQYFEQAIAEDPSFARAYTALADSYVMAPQVMGILPDEVVSKIRTAATKALQLDASLGEPHFDLAICAEYEFDWAAAEREFKKGLALSPGNAVGHLWYARFLAITGRKDQVLVQRRIAAELDPVSPYAVQAVGGYYSVTGSYDAAIEHFRHALALEPTFGLAHQGLGIAYLLKGMRADAITELQEANRMMPGTRRSALLGYAYGVAGQSAEARKILDDLLKSSQREPVSALSIAEVYIGLGDKDRAFEWLEKAVDQRDLDLTLQWDSLYDSLRSDPRYTRLLRRMKLA